MSASKRNPRPAHGLFPTLQERSKMRRETQKKLLTIRDDARSRPGRRNDLIPDLQVNYLAVDRLKPAKRRVRKIDAIQAARIDRSVAEFGVCVPVLINGENIIVHGHGVFEAAKRAGLERSRRLRLATFLLKSSVPLRSH